MDPRFMFYYLGQEIRAAWAAGSNFDRFIAVVFVACVPYDLWRGNWFDLIVAAAALVWVWHSIRADATHGDL